MKKNVELQGRWWLPDHEDHQVFGTLKWDPTEGGALQLEDELRPVVWKNNPLADGSVQKYREGRGDTQLQYPVVFGQADNRALTLLDAFRRSVRGYGTGESAELVHVNRFIDGAWFGDPDELRVDRVIVDLRHLTGWVNRSGLDVDYHLNNPADDVFAVIMAKSLPTFKIDHIGGSVGLAQGLHVSGDRVHLLGIAQDWSLQLVKPQPEPLQGFIETASDFQNLLTTAVGEAAVFENVVIQHPALPTQSLAGTPIANWRQDIAYHVQWTVRAKPSDPVKEHDMYFTFDELGGIDGIGRWLTVAENYRTELGRVMATRHSDDMYIEDRVMNVIAALDSFDRIRRSTETRVDYVERVKACIDLAGEPFLDLIATDAEEWAKTVKETRHDLAHHRERFRVTGSVGEHLLAEQLFWLFAMCMLRLADAPATVFEAIRDHGQIRWLTERAQETASARRELG